MKIKKSGSMVGKYFHSRESDGTICWQGQVILEPAPGIYLVQLFDWVMGQESTQRLVSLEKMQMQAWLFYDTGDAMKFSYEHGSAYPHRADVKEKQQQK